MQAKFSAAQTVSIQVPEARVSIQHYLRQPHRLIYALVEPSQTQQLSNDCFRLKMRSRQFMMLTIQPIVDIKLWTDQEGTLHLKAIRCELEGLDFVNQRFELFLDGFLYLNKSNALEGQANLAVEVEIPPMLWMTPRAIITATGNGMLKSILASVKHRLVQQIVRDYMQWVKSISSSDKTVGELKSSKILPRPL